MRWWLDSLPERRSVQLEIGALDHIRPFGHFDRDARLHRFYAAAGNDDAHAAQLVFHIDLLQHRVGFPVQQRHSIARRGGEYARSDKACAKTAAWETMHGPSFAAIIEQVHSIVFIVAG